MRRGDRKEAGRSPERATPQEAVQTGASRVSSLGAFLTEMSVLRAEAGRTRNVKWRVMHSPREVNFTLAIAA